MIRAGKPEASAAIWDWRAIPDERSRRAARKRALVRFVVASLAGAALFYFGRATIASLAWSAGALTLVLAVVAPRAHAALDRLVARLAALVGVALTWLLLSPVFYLFFTPFGLLFRRGARDPMQRRFDPRASSYWKARDDRPNLERPF